MKWLDLTQGTRELIVAAAANGLRVLIKVAGGKELTTDDLKIRESWDEAEKRVLDEQENFDSDVQ